MVAKIQRGFGRPKRISHKQLGLFLGCCGFLRFEIVWLIYDDSSLQSIDEKCHLFVKHLEPLSAGFNDSTIIKFNANMKDDQSHFRDPLQLLNHLRNELLPICASARCYEFLIRFFSHESSATNIFDSILQMPPINFSTNLEFNLFHPANDDEILTRLSVDTISAWLDRPNGVIMKHRNTPLELDVYLEGVQNTQELFEHFKKVYFPNAQFVN